MKKKGQKLLITVDEISNTPQIQELVSAFQALGYVYWENQPVKNINDIIPEYDRLLIANSYSKIWSDLSLKQRSLCRIIAASSSNKVADIRKSANMNSNVYNGFQNRLIHQGILLKNARGGQSALRCYVSENLSRMLQIYMNFDRKAE